MTFFVNDITKKVKGKSTPWLDESTRPLMGERNKLHLFLFINNPFLTLAPKFV